MEQQRSENPAGAAVDLDRLADLVDDVVDAAEGKRLLVVDGVVEDNAVAEISDEPFAFHAWAASLDGVEDLDTNHIDEVGQKLTRGALIGLRPSICNLRYIASLSAQQAAHSVSAQACAPSNASRRSGGKSSSIRSSFCLTSSLMRVPHG